MKNKIFALLALVMALAVICTMSVAIFADDTSTAPDASADTETDNTDDAAGDAADDTASDTASDDSSETTGDTSDDDAEEEKEPTWWDNYNQIIGWIVAVIIFVAIVLVSIWWIKSGFRPTKKN